MTEEPKRGLLALMSNALIATFALGLAGLIALVLIIRGNAQAGVTDPLAVAIVVSDPHTGQQLETVKPKKLGLVKPPRGTPVITVDSTDHQQRITGFGATMTDTAARAIAGLSNDTRYHLLAELFDTKYLRLNILRVPMGATQASGDGAPYTYDDGGVDPDLARFSIEHDRSYILPMLTKALSHNWDMRFLATPWSVPAWMKTNGALTNRAGSGTLDPQYAQAYAQYFVRFLKAYASAGIDISAITPANQPGRRSGGVGMNISAAEEVKLIDADLIPALRSAGLQTRIYGGDLNWYDSGYASSIATSAASSAVIGLAYHCYFGNPYVMSEVHDEDTALGAIVSECDPAASRVPLAETIIGSLRNWASQVDLGAIAGDSSLPSGAGRAGLVSVDDRTDSYTDDASYYELGQASEFIHPGAWRVPTNTFASYHYKKDRSYVTAGVDNVAAVNPNGSVALLAYNNAPKARTFAVKWEGHYFTYRLRPGATASFLWNH